MYLCFAKSSLYNIKWITCNDKDLLLVNGSASLCVTIFMPAIALQDHDLKSEEQKLNSDNWLFTYYIYNVFTFNWFFFI